MCHMDKAENQDHSANVVHQTQPKCQVLIHGAALCPSPTPSILPTKLLPAAPGLTSISVHPPLHPQGSTLVPAWGVSKEGKDSEAAQIPTAGGIPPQRCHEHRRQHTPPYPAEQEGCGRTVSILWNTWPCFSLALYGVLEPIFILPLIFSSKCLK